MNDYTKHSDEILVTLLREDSPACDKAFDAVFSKYSANLNSYCIFKSGSREDAEEVFEDTWLKFIDSVRAGKEIKNILPFLYTIARNLIIDRFRKKNANKSINIEYRDLNDLDEIANPFHLQTQLDLEELISLVKIAVGSLEETYREAFVMQWFGGLTHSEIGEILEITQANAKMRCHRAMNEVIKILKPYYINS